MRFNGLVAKLEDDDGPSAKRFRIEYEKISLDEELKKPLRKKGFSYSPGSFVSSSDFRFTYFSVLSCCVRYQ